MCSEGMMVVCDRITLEFDNLSVLWLCLILEGHSELAALVLTSHHDSRISHLHHQQLLSKLVIQRVHQLLLELLNVVNRQLPHQPVAFKAEELVLVVAIDLERLWQVKFLYHLSRLQSLLLRQCFQLGGFLLFRHGCLLALLSLTDCCCAVVVGHFDLLLRE